jgi:hypothetical protein
MVSVYEIAPLPPLTSSHSPFFILFYFKNVISHIFFPVDFIVNFEYAQTLLKEAIKDSASFAMFLRASLSNPDLECKDMADFLIMPVQRIPRYPFHSN